MLTVVGDVHDWTDRYVNKVRDLEASIQVGDMAHNYSRLVGLDENKHKFIGGNHDNYNLYFDEPHALGDYGTAKLGGVEFFFIRGAFSIDFAHRTPHKDWWPNEEMNTTELIACAEAYARAKPEIVITHDCPMAISKIIGNPNVLIGFGFNPERFTTRTQVYLSSMLCSHHPKLWIFGHYHQSRVIKYKGTEFRCLNELETFNINSKD